MPRTFFYDVWVYLTSSSGNIGNLEFDVNQTMPNGNTVLMGVQCDGWTGHWAYTVNTGSASNVRPKWVSKSGSTCNPRHWTINKWHHVQASFSRDSSGYITYHSIWLDGVETAINAKVLGAADLGWGDVINTQFQVDGYGSSGSVTAYVDGLEGLGLVGSQPRHSNISFSVSSPRPTQIGRGHFFLKCGSRRPRPESMGSEPSETPTGQTRPTAFPANSAFPTPDTGVSFSEEMRAAELIAPRNSGSRK